MNDTCVFCSKTIETTYERIDFPDGTAAHHDCYDSGGGDADCDCCCEGDCPCEKD